MFFSFCLWKWFGRQLNFVHVMVQNVSYCYVGSTSHYITILIRKILFLLRKNKRTKKFCKNVVERFILSGFPHEAQFCVEAFPIHFRAVNSWTQCYRYLMPIQDSTCIFMLHGFSSYSLTPITWSWARAFAASQRAQYDRMYFNARKSVFTDPGTPGTKKLFIRSCNLMLFLCESFREGS